MRRIIAILIAALGLLTATAVPSQAVLNGQPDRNRHPYVGEVFNWYDSCSGAAISPTLVVTAAHCLWDGTDLWVSFDEEPATASDGWPVLGPGPRLYHGTGYAPPNSVTEEKYGDWSLTDVAVVVLDEPVHLPRYASLPSLKLDNSLKVGTPLTQVGYGVDGMTRGHGVPQWTFSDSRNDAAATFRGIGGTPKADNYIKVAANGPIKTCFGDSGGPYLLGDTITAVVSGSNSNRCSSPEYAARVDTAPILNFIKSHL